MVEFGEGRRGRRRETLLAAVLLVIALALFFLPAAYQASVRESLRSTIFRPFIMVQAELAGLRGQRVNVRELRAERDSLAALAAAQAALAEENRRLRSLLALRERAPAAFVPSELIRPGVPGSESTFLLNVGRAQGVQVGSPVLSADGLLGVVWEADERTAQGIDWSHPEFRASAMTASGESYGIVEARRGAHREGDLLALTGAPFHSDIPRGTRIVTSGRGGLIPRGIPVGIVVDIEEADTGWRKSYVLRPAVRTEGVTHVLVGVRAGSERLTDFSSLWYIGARPDPLAGGQATSRNGESTAERR